MNPSSYKQAVKLREAGYSYTYISQKTGVGKGTLSYWLTSIPYTPNIYTLQQIGNARAKSGQFKNKQKQQTLSNAITAAKGDIGKLSKRDLFMLGLGIYIGEGTKTNDQIRVVNCDPNVIRTSVNWFKNICGLKEANFVARIHGYPDTNVEKAIKYWSREINLPITCFAETQIDHRTGKSKIRTGKLPFGTLHLTIRSNGNKNFGVFLARRINAWISLAFQQAGIV